ncbi:MAG TPA: hypothetical protein VKE96_22225 [Vicinamibacterales bacterium]|nr:hypothetical protein [Vicinamibacterales bacterium]
MPPLQLATLTPQAVQQSLQNNGLTALGLTTVSLTTRWSDATPAANAYDSNALTLDLGQVVRAPFLGVRENAYTDAASTLAANLTATSTTLTVKQGDGGAFPAPTAGGRILLTLSNASGSKQETVECTNISGDSFTIVRGALGTAKQQFSQNDRVVLKLTPAQRSGAFSEVDGSPVSGHCTVLRFHPQAFGRLQTVCATRYNGLGQPLTLPLPAALLVRNAPAFRAARWYRPDEQLDDATGVISFHDARGFIVDPIYVAALVADLLTALPGLQPAAVTAAANGPGGVTNIAALASGTLLHFIDPHGNPPQIGSPGANLITSNSNTAINTQLITLAAGDTVAANSATTPLRFGLATNGTMGKTALAPPALAQGTLARRFYRVMVVDSPFYLLGNRTKNQVNTIDPDDGRIPPELLPVVRDQVNIDYTVDGPETLGEATRILNRPSQNMILAVSPVIDQTLLTPAGPGANALWPAFPAPNTNAAFPAPPVRLTSANVTAAFTAGKDVVVTLAVGAAPDGATVRIFPQQFVEIHSINASEPSFVRGDGGASIAVALAPTNVLLINPFNLGAAQPKPNPAVLTMDIVVAPRVGRRRLTGALAVNVAAGPAAVPPTPFFGPAAGNIMGTMPPTAQGVAESPLFGIPTTITPPAAQPADFLGLVLSLASEAAPRQAPRLPTMARFETVAVTGTTGGTPTGTLLWEGLLTGGRWAGEARSAQHAEGNPGNPAGPDVHAPAVSVTGALAYDLALHAARRVQSIIPRPLPGGGWTNGWIALTGGDNFNQPDDSANGTNTGTGVLLETVAVGCETSWLSNFDTPDQNTTLDTLLQNAAQLINVPKPDPGTINLNNEARLQQQVRREFFAAKQGFRDAQWSLRRAFAQARELVYIESPQFARTARPSGSPQPYELDLVAVLAGSLTAHKNLRVIICTPRFSDYASNFETFHRQHYAARMEALGDLQAAAKDRVLLFHPVGFPGRVAYIRTTSIIVDDVWCLVGTTHFRRRGMTFDGSAAIASFDRHISDGYSTKVRNYRRSLMAAKLNVPAPAAGQPLSGEWVRLGSPAGAFDVVHDLLEQGGFGRLQSIWPGPPDHDVATAQPEVADPDGSNGATMYNTLAAMFNEAGS